MFSICDHSIFDLDDLTCLHQFSNIASQLTGKKNMDGPARRKLISKGGGAMLWSLCASLRYSFLKDSNIMFHPEDVRSSNATVHTSVIPCSGQFALF